MRALDLEPADRIDQPGVAGRLHTVRRFLRAGLDIPELAPIVREQIDRASHEAPRIREDDLDIADLVLDLREQHLKRGDVAEKVLRQMERALPNDRLDDGVDRRAAIARRLRVEPAS